MTGRPRILLQTSELPAIAAGLERHAEIITDASAQIDGVIGSARLEAAAYISPDRLHDATDRSSFYETAYTLARIREALAAVPSRAAGLVYVQATHKFLFMAHSPEGQKRLGRMVAGKIETAIYVREVIDVLRRPPTRGGHVNVMLHMLGYLDLPSDRKYEILGAIESFRLEKVDRHVAMSMLRAEIEVRDVDDWLAAQVYLAPYPEALDHQ